MRGAPRLIAFVTRFRAGFAAVFFFAAIVFTSTERFTTMRDSVRAAFVHFSAPLEGVVSFFYLDARGLVTIAMGNLVDPLSTALELPLVHPDGSPATRDEIATDWSNVKSRQDLSPRGGMAFSAVARLHLTGDGIQEVVGAKLDEMDGYLSRRFTDWANWPAPAQLATLSVAWACGPAFAFPRLAAFLQAGDFAGAATECTIHPETGTIVRRNALDRALYLAASRVVATCGDLEELVLPPGVPPDAPTDPTPMAA